MSAISATCKHCRRRIHLTRYGWVHTRSGWATCHPTTRAEP